MIAYLIELNEKHEGKKTSKRIVGDVLHIIRDAPYLAPMPFRGKRNESAYINHVAQKVALTHNVSLEQVSKQTTENAKNLFGI